MKKVGILSMQRIANYGSFLQAYGLKKMLEDLGCEVEFVDYHPGKTLLPAPGGTGITRKISKVMETLSYGAPLREKLRFIKYKKNYSQNYFPYLGIGEKRNYHPQLDMLVIGSDEVFNCVQANTNVGFSGELFGEGNRAERLISYAASFGNTTEEKLRSCTVEVQVAQWLRKFDAISVRDRNSGEIVTALTDVVPVHNLDPVLMYPYLDRCDQIPDTVPEQNYMLLYGYTGRFTAEECRKIRRYAKQKQLRIFCIGGVQDCCDRFIDCSPFEVIGYFKNAHCVVTDTFHGTILSVITHRSFATVVRTSGYGNAEKLTDLLQSLELTDRVIDDLENLQKMLSNPIDYEKVDRILEEERVRTQDYLKTQINAI